MLSPNRDSAADHSTTVSKVGQSAATEKCSLWFLLMMPVGVGFALGLVITVVQSLREVDTRSIYLGLDGMRAPLAFAACTFALLVFAVVWFRPRIKTLALVAALLLVVGVGLYRTVRIESFYGNMIPRLAWRWSPTAEQEISTYLVSTPRTSARREAYNALFAETERDFPGFLGANRDAKITSASLASDWNAEAPKLLWRHPVGLGWSSFAAVGEVAINLEQRGTDECIVCYGLRTAKKFGVIASHVDLKTSTAMARARLQRSRMDVSTRWAPTGY